MTDAPAPIPEEMVEKVASIFRSNLDAYPPHELHVTMALHFLEAAGVPALLARVAELEGALAPFGTLASQYEDYEDDTPLQSAHAPSWRGEPAFADLTIGGLRKAAALAKKTITG